MCVEGGHRGRLRVYKFFAMFTGFCGGKKYDLLRPHLIVFGHDANTPIHHAKVANKVKDFSRHDSVHFHTKYFSGVGISEDHETKNHHVPEKSASVQACKHDEKRWDKYGHNMYMQV